MRPLKFPDEVKNLYLKQYHMINNYIRQWINTSLKIESNTDEIQISTDVLLILSKLFELSGTHRAGKLQMRFDPSSGEIASSYRIEQFIYQIGTKYNIKFNFFLMDYLDSQVVTKQLYDDIKSIDHTDYTLSNFYYEIDYRDLDLSRSDQLNIRDSIRDLSTRISRQEFQEWKTKELSPVFDMTEFIHQSFFELNDTKTILRSFITDLYPVPALYVQWLFAMIPDLLLLSYKKSHLSADSKSYINQKDLNVHIPFLVLELEINKL